ncbi:unnamed protein product [Allacma fusca]|uniref:Uncharacterized protein n=1 Tax=Allacma fusca TaxID=39272 RepID=A0A8J2K002_9HEXA|nr:unnamed protein product [Allacma fusca]
MSSDSQHYSCSRQSQIFQVLHVSVVFEVFVTEFKMKVKNLALLGLMVCSCFVLTSGSTRLAIPLVPVAVYYSITNHWPYLVGAGLGAAALLKLKGAATVGTYLYLRDKGVVDLEFDHTQAGWNSHIAEGYDQRRYRRSLGKNENDVTGITFNPSLDEVLAYDELGCGLRLVCELSAVPQDSLQEDEKIILALFGGEEKLPDPYRATRGKLSYAYATLLGKAANDPQVCQKVYGKCPHQGEQIMEVLRANNV